MKSPEVNTRTIVLICLAVIAGILCWYFFSGVILQPAGPLETGPTTKNTTTEVPLEIDADFAIAEANIPVVHFLPIVHVT
jgi:hypothetical protein